MVTLNVYQKAVILVGGTLLPLLLFMGAMGYRYVWSATVLGTALVALLVYTLRNAQQIEEGASRG